MGFESLSRSMVRKNMFCEACAVSNQLQVERQYIFVVDENEGVCLCPFHTAVYDSNPLWRFHFLDLKPKVVYRHSVKDWLCSTPRIN